MSRQDSETSSSSSEDNIEGVNFKVVILGDGAVGKTSLFERFVKNCFAQSYKQTIGVDFFMKKIILPGNVEAALTLWDIGGQQLGSRMLANYLSGVNAVVLCYDITNYESFKNLTDWLEYVNKSLNENPLLVVMGNKVDLNHMRAVRLEAHDNFVAFHNTMSFFVSAKTGDNVNAAFKQIAAKLGGVTLSRREIEADSRVVEAPIVNHPTKHPKKRNVNKKRLCILQ
eukprot:gb/GECH01012892.1/.p1 GENE.gb/GECH01012892.1/~~gb/GECH01012892.1/.p1  ORF type:complete len:227 (+),score=30.22 gb/GECH01012892.1/:1-681(+)